MFDKHKIENEHDKGGYGEWFSSNENIDNRKFLIMRWVQFLNKRKEDKGIIVKTDIQDVTNNSGMYNLTGEQPDYYESDIFSATV